MKRWLQVTLIGILLLNLLTAIACGKEYRQDIAAETVGRQAIDALSITNGEYYAEDDDSRAVYFRDQKAYSVVEDSAIFYHSDGTNVDRLGVFRVRTGENVENVRQMVQEYLDGQLAYLRSFAANYHPTEITKLNGARVQVLGQYVVFTVLNTKDTETARQSILKSISK